MKLSDHFSLQEAVFSSTAERLGIVNLATPDVIEHAKVAAEGMEQVRALLGDLSIHVDSWIRCEALEKVVAASDFKGWCAKHGKPSVPSSWDEYFKRKAHPKGFAVDFVCPAYGTPLEIVQAISKSPIQFDQCIQEGTWVHISFDPQLRCQVLTATFANGAATYSKGIAA